ncbi:hypothetical protein [Stenotrophomonas maltophilia]|uniref:hypothetical protein n=1 Tax=Stenotrophomonas maltophilia TaxID=40324 RepID=UPI003D7E08EB
MRALPPFKRRSAGLASFVLLVATTIAGCGTTPAPEFGGRWRPLDRFADVSTPILLQSRYVYYVAPVDRTLKGVLERWAADSGVPLTYRSAHDFTLHAGSSGVRATDLGTAVQQMESAYQRHGLQIRFESGTIVVRVAGDAANMEKRS